MMTWGEFKAWVETHGIKDTDEIEWIDVVWPRPENLEIDYHNVSDSPSITIVSGWYW